MIIAASAEFRKLIPGSAYAVKNGPDIQLFSGDILYASADSMIISTNSSLRKYGLGGYIYGNSNARGWGSHIDMLYAYRPMPAFLGAFSQNLVD